MGLAGWYGDTQMQRLDYRPIIMKEWMMLLDRPNI